MKSASLIKTLGTFVVLVAVAALLDSGVYAHEETNAIEGTIAYIDREEGYLQIDGSEILGFEPLYLQKETCVFDGCEGVSFAELEKDAETISALNRLELDDLHVGCEVWCTYYNSKDGDFIANTIVITMPPTIDMSM